MKSLYINEAFRIEYINLCRNFFENNKGKTLNTMFVMLGDVETLKLQKS